MEELHFGDSVTLFAESLFGFLHGGSLPEERSVFVQSLETKHRAGTDSEIFRLHVKSEFSAQEALHSFLLSHELHHPSDAERTLQAVELQELAELQGLAEAEIRGNEDNQLFQVGRPLCVGQVFQLQHQKTNSFVTVEPSASSDGLSLRLAEGSAGSLLRMRSPTLGSAPKAVFDQDIVTIESVTFGGKSVACTRLNDAGYWTATVSSQHEPVRFTISMHSKAKPTLSKEALQWSSLSQASSKARKYLEDARATAEGQRAQLAKGLNQVDSSINDAQRSFDQAVLHVMLHFQELHQALEARENQILSEARALMATSRSEHLKLVREEVEQACQDTDQVVELVSRVLAVQSEAEVLQMIPHAQRKISSTAATSSALTEVLAAKKLVDGSSSANIGFTYNLDDSLLEAISGHGNIVGLEVPFSASGGRGDTSLNSSAIHAGMSLHHSALGGSQRSHVKDKKPQQDEQNEQKFGADMHHMRGISHPSTAVWLSNLRDSGTRRETAHKDLNTSRNRASARPSSASALASRTGAPTNLGTPNATGHAGGHAAAGDREALHQRSTKASLYHQRTPNRRVVAAAGDQPS